MNRYIALQIALIVILTFTGVGVGYIAGVNSYEPTMCPTHADVKDELAQLKVDYNTLLHDYENIARLKRINETGLVAEVEYIKSPPVVITTVTN